MTLYTVKWTETHTFEVDFDTVGEAEALEAFWAHWNDAQPAWNDAETTRTSGPQDIEVSHYTALVLRSPTTK